MVRTTRGYVNPLLWGVFGWFIALGGNALAEHVMAIFGAQILHGQLRHVDELFVGVAMGVMRWIHGEWQIDDIHHSRQMETKIRSALQILSCSNNEEYRRRAVADILEAFERHRPLHPDFRLALEDFYEKRFGSKVIRRE